MTTASDSAVHITAMRKPQSPRMRPEGIGLFGSLVTWLVPQTSGPVSRIPATIRCQRPLPPRPEETTPQEKAHIGANQVTGFSSSRQANRAGRATVAVIGLSFGAIGRQVAEPVAPQLHVEALSAEPEHLGGRGAVVAGELQRGLD